MRRTYVSRAAVAFTMLIATVSFTGQASAAGCAGASSGGEWRNFGNDLANTRSQPAENVIGTSNVGTLEPKWILPVASIATGVSGGFQNTPIIADGCLYVATTAGWVASLNADTGSTNWTRKLNGNSEALIGTVITGSPAIGNGKVYVGVGRTGSPYVQELDQATGVPGWSTTVETGTPSSSSSFLVAGPQLFYPDPILYPSGLLFQGFMGKEAQPTNARGGYAILNAATGAIVKKGYTISDAAYAAGARGASIWGVSAVDDVNLYVYSPTGNPASKVEDANANAIVKIDVNPARATFGTIVGSYHGLPDNYVTAVDLYDQAACQATNGAGVIWAQSCAQLDLDFGAAPSLFTSNGQQLVGDLQKAGVYHAVRTDTMTAAWTATVGTPQFDGNSNSAAVANGRVYTAAQSPGHLVGLQANDGFPAWASPMPDGLHYHAVSTANGVVYTGDSLGNLRAFDASTGVPLLVSSMSLANGQNATDNANSSGIAIARNTVYYPTGTGFLAAYRLP